MYRRIGRCQRSKQQNNDILKINGRHGTVTLTLNPNFFRTNNRSKLCIMIKDVGNSERKCAENNTINFFVNCNQHFGNFKS